MVKPCVCWRVRNAAGSGARDIMHAGVAAAGRHFAGSRIMKAAAAIGLEYTVGVTQKLTHCNQTFLTDVLKLYFRGNIVCAYERQIKPVENKMMKVAI